MSKKTSALTVVMMLSLAVGFSFGQRAKLTFSVLKNATLEFEGETIQFRNGRCENRVADHWTEAYEILPNVALGDLNHDGVSDAAAIVIYNGGGSGTFVYLVALRGSANPIKAMASKLLGDRVEIKLLQINSQGIIAVSLVRQGPEDPLCCPTMSTIERYRVAAGPHFEQLQ